MTRYVLDEKIVAYLNTIPNREFCSDKPGTLADDLKTAMGADESEEEIQRAVLRLIGTHKAAALKDSQRHIVGIRSSASSEEADPDLRALPDDLLHVVLTKCIQALMAQSESGKNAPNVIKELVTPAQSPSSSAKYLRDLGFYKWGFQRRSYTIIDLDRTEVTEQEVQQLLGNAPSQAPSQTSEAVSDETSTDQPLVNRDLREIVGELVERLETSEQTVRDQQTTIENLNSQLETERADHQTQLAKLRVQITQLQEAAELPSELDDRLRRLIDSRPSD